MSYQTAVDWIIRNQETFTRMLELIERYPMLADHRCMETFWTLLSFVVSKHQLERKFSKRTIPNISVTLDNKKHDDVFIKRKPNICQISVVGLSLDGPCFGKWADLLLQLASTASVRYLRSCVGREIKNTYHLTHADVLVFILSDFSVNDTFCREILESAFRAEISVVYLRELDFTFPNNESKYFCNKILSLQGISTVQKREYTSLPGSPIRSQKLEFCWNTDDPYKLKTYTQDDNTYEHLYRGYKNAIVFTGTNEDTCISTILSRISGTIARCKNTLSPNSSGYFTYPGNLSSVSRSFSSTSLASSVSSAPVSNSVSKIDKKIVSTPPDKNIYNFPSSTSYGKYSIDSSNTKPAPKEQSKLLNETYDDEDNNNGLQKENTSDEHIFVVFPFHHNGKSSGDPKCVKWPPTPKDNDNNDPDDNPLLSDISVGFEDIDLSITLQSDYLASDEDIL